VSLMQLHCFMSSSEDVSREEQRAMGTQITVCRSSCGIHCPPCLLTSLVAPPGAVFQESRYLRLQSLAVV